MTYRGLFIGIDRYASSKINALSFAKSDAVAMYSLFADTLGDGATILTDEKATRATITSEFNDLTFCDKDDVVVIYFSGHGSKTHELITYDTDIKQLDTTAIPLDTLTEWFSRIPAKRLICILDCCFSGGMGAKVLQTDATLRSLSSTIDILDQLSGNGRIIFTASSPTEPAWERTKVAHGLLTYYLLEALQGAVEVRLNGKVSVYRLLEYVSERVKSDSAQLGKIQHPTLRATMDDAISWPIFVPGRRYLTAFPELKQVTVTEDIRSLEGYSFPSSLIDTWVGSIPTLNSLQLEAINEFNVLDGAHLVVSAPTSSGKTMIGELATLKGCLERKRAFFLLPLKALVYDKYHQFNRTYGDFGIKTIRATGETTDDIPDLMRGRYDICLMTYEKFSALVLAYPHLLEQVGTIVIDEVQMIADETRGANLEFILTLLRVERQRQVEPQLIALSAVIGDTNGLESWLGARLLRRSERPVPLDEGVLRADGSFRYTAASEEQKVIPSYIQPLRGTGSSQDWIIPLVRKLVSEGKQVIIFREQRGQTRGCAQYLARELGLPPAQAALDALPVGDLSSSSNDLRVALRGGVAFHNSNLDRNERLVVEAEFRAPNSTIRAIAATTTLAMGVNTPAEAVVVVGLEHPGKPSKPYSIAEYKNIIGRAGRLGYATQGTSYLLALSAHDENYAWTRYIRGHPENLQSRFLARDTDPRSLILRVLASAQRFTDRGMTAEAIIAFLEGSFGAFQQMQQSHTWQWDKDQFTQAIASLEQHKLIELKETDNYVSTELGRLSGESGVEVETIVRLIDTLRAAAPTDIHEQTLVAATQIAVEMDDIFFPMNMKSTHKEPTYWVFQLEQQQVSSSVIHAIQRTITQQHQGTLRAKKAVACLLWMTDLPIADIEQTALRFGGGTDGAAGAIRSVCTRTCDILPVAARIVEILHPSLSLQERVRRLIARLEIGVPDSAADLAIISGGRLERSDYQRLIKAKRSTIEAIEVSSDDDLLLCLADSRNSQYKVAELRRAVKAYHEAEGDMDFISIIPPYK